MPSIFSHLYGDIPFDPNVFQTHNKPCTLFVSFYAITFFELFVIHSFSIGNVICSVDNPAKVTNRIEARILVFNIEVPITVGFPVRRLLLCVRLLCSSFTTDIILQTGTLLLTL